MEQHFLGPTVLSFECQRAKFVEASEYRCQGGETSLRAEDCTSQIFRISAKNGTKTIHKEYSVDPRLLVGTREMNQFNGSKVWVMDLRSGIVDLGNI